MKKVVRLTESDLVRIVKRVINEDKLDSIPRYGTDTIRNIENNGFHQTVTFYPKRPRGFAFTIADKVDVMRMYDELEKNNIDGRVVFGPFFHQGGIEPKSLTVIVDKNDLEKVIDIIKNSNHLGLNPPLQPYPETYYSHS